VGLVLAEHTKIFHRFLITFPSVEQLYPAFSDQFLCVVVHRPMIHGRHCAPVNCAIILPIATSANIVFIDRNHSLVAATFTGKSFRWNTSNDNALIHQKLLKRSQYLI
jgi:hypothetical protein